MLNLDSRGQSKFDTDVSCITLATVAVAIRLFCKFRHKQGIGSDDYWIITALAFYSVSTGLMLWGTITGGGGKEMAEIKLIVNENPTNAKVMHNYLESLYLGFMFTIWVNYTVKMSILFFYRHIFFITKGYQWASYTVIALCTISFIATIVPGFLVCVPLDAFWNRLKPGKCLDFKIYFVTTGAVDITLDFIILVLPIRMIFTLQLPLRTKLAVAGVFALGSFAVVTNILRVYYMYQPHAHYASYFNGERWTHIHIVTAIVCACLPIYKPLLNSFYTATGNILSRYVVPLRSISGSTNNRSKNDSYVRMRQARTPANSAKPREGDSESGIERYGMKEAHITTSVKGGVENHQVPLQVPNGSIGYSRIVEVV